MLLTLKAEQKKVTANIVTLKFETFPKMIIQDGLALIPKARLEVVNPMAK